MKSPYKFPAGSIVLFGSYVDQLTTGRRKAALGTLPAGAWRSTILPFELAAVICWSSGTSVTPAVTPRLPVGFAYGTGPATASLRTRLPMRSSSLVDDGVKREIL